MTLVRGIAALIAAAGFAAALAGCATPAAKPPSTFGRNLDHHPQRGVFLRGIPNHAAGRAGADAAVLADVLNFWGVKVTPENVNAALRRDHGEWEWDAAVATYCAFHKLVAFFTPGSLDELKVRLRSGMPVIIRLQDDSRDAPRYSVVVGFDDEARLCLCHEGGKAPVLRDYDALSAAWEMSKWWMLVIAPPEMPAWPLSGAERLARARFHEAARRYRLAARDYEALRDSNPNDAELCLVLANVYRLDGELNKAEILYRHMLSLNDLDGRAANNLAYVLAEMKQSLDEALQLARRATMLAPANAVAMDTLGYVYLARGEYDEAARILEKARSRARTLPPDQQNEIAMHLVWAHYRGGQLHLARQVLADVRRLDPAFPVPEELAGLLESQP